MRKLETAAHNLAIALSEFSRALDSEYRSISRNLSQQGDLFPRRNAQVILQNKLKKLTAHSQFAPVQAGGINGAWQSWGPKNRPVVNTQKKEPLL
jgi:hypothetical protein